MRLSERGLSCHLVGSTGWRLARVPPIDQIEGHSRLSSDEQAQLDLALLRRIRGGDETALAPLLDCHWAAVIEYAMSMLGDADRAQDAAQECFIRLWERRESWTLEGSVRGLLLRLTRNLVLDDMRRAEAQARAASHVLPMRPPRTPEDDAEDAELRAAIDAAVRALPPRRREVFILIRYQGLPVREAAQVLGIAPQTVANHLNLALASLRAALAHLARTPP